MEKALKYCKEALKSAEGHQLFMVQYRVANINHRLASLFHNALRGEVLLVAPYSCEKCLLKWGNSVRNVESKVKLRSRLFCETPGQDG